MKTPWPEPESTRRKMTRALGIGMVGVYLDLVLRTARVRIEADPEAWALMLGRTDETVIIVFWHEILPMMPALWWQVRRRNRQLRLAALISRHRDGRLIAGIMRRWNIRSVDGSSGRPGKSDKGGAAALRAMLRVLRERGIVALTPDGPRGPRRVMQPGAAQLAALSGVRVVPIAALCHPEVRVRSWDRMQVPMPFSRLVLRCGAPIAVARGQQQAATLLLSQALEALYAQPPRPPVSHVVAP